MAEKNSQNPSESTMGRPEKEVDPESLGGQIRIGRKKKGYNTTKSFAEALKVQPPTLIRWETNQIVPSALVLDRINQILDTKIVRPKTTHASKGKLRKGKAGSEKIDQATNTKASEYRQQIIAYINGLSDEALESYGKLVLGIQNWMSQPEPEFEGMKPIRVSSEVVRRTQKLYAYNVELTRKSSRK